jgi:hypothetical protein
MLINFQRAAFDVAKYNWICDAAFYHILYMRLLLDLCASGICRTHLMLMILSDKPSFSTKDKRVAGNRCAAHYNDFYILLQM